MKDNIPNLQTLQSKSIKTRIHKAIISNGKKLYKYDKMLIGKRPSVFELYSLKVIDELICNDICWVGEKEENEINNFLVFNNYG